MYENISVTYEIALGGTMEHGPWILKATVPGSPGTVFYKRSGPTSTGLPSLAEQFTSVEARDNAVKAWQVVLDEHVANTNATLKSASA